MKHNLSLVSNVWIKQIPLKAGEVVAQHVHTFDHQTLLAVGSARVFVDGVAREFTAPQIIVIRAGLAHVIEALEDSVIYCIHALRSSEKEQDIISPDDEIDLSKTYPISVDVPNEANPLL